MLLRYKSITFLTIVMLTFLYLDLSESYRDGLYSTEDDDVIPLNNTSLETRVEHSQPDVFWVVEFYNSWCGHCIHFAPSYKKLAKGLKDWRDLVLISAIDCSQSWNLDSCRDFDISAYPSIKIFPPSAVKNRLKNIEQLKSQDPLELKKSIIKFMTKYAPVSWPRLEPLEKIEDIWKEKKDSHKHVLLIFEESNSVLGLEVILDLRHTPNVLIQSMLKEKVTKFGISKFPSLYRVNPDSTYTLLAVGDRMPADDRVLFVDTVQNLVKGDTENLNMVTKESQKTKGSAGVKGIESADPLSHDKIPSKNFNSSVVSMQDLESAIHYSFRQEVAICKTIDGEKFVMLKDFVHILMKYFPGRPPIQGFLSRVYQMLTNLKSPSLSGEEWMDMIDRLQNAQNFLPEVVRWESCLGSMPRYRGFPCSMWMLFHTLTVGAYNQNSLARVHNPQEVLRAISGYMKHFFGCEECSKNFLQMSMTMKEEVKTLKGSVLWLWSAHNKANKRLHGDVSEDPKHLKIQFPSEQLCPKCRTKPVPGSTNPSWDMEEVAEFLISYYSRNIMMPRGLQSGETVLNYIQEDKSDSASKQFSHQELDWWEKMQREQDLMKIRLLRSKKHDKSHIEKSQMYLKYEHVQADKSLWGLSQVDLSMCVAFYVGSTVMILLMYHHFIMRRHSNSCKTLKNSSFIM